MFALAGLQAILLHQNRNRNRAEHRMQVQHLQAVYRQKLLEEIVALRPKRILEVGCGGGSFLRNAAKIGAELHGVDPDPALIEPLRQEGFSVEVGRAEQLAYADNSFDVVVFSYTAHHIEDWDMALKESLRVAQSVAILDPWYDITIPSQAMAARLDQWSKTIDRATGMVHKDCMSAATLLEPLRDRLPMLDVRYDYMLILRPTDISEIRQYVHEQLKKVPDAQRWTAGADSLLADVEANGCSEDGAVLMRISQRRNS